MKLRKNPHIYEINLMTWLEALSRREQRKIDLRSIPLREWRDLKALGMDLVWLMGMWHRSPDSRRRARAEPQLVKACGNILEDFNIEDIVGSAYAVHDYRPDPAFGSLEDLRTLKATLEDEGLQLVLDFVPNHTACDHPWITQYPERYVLGEKKGEAACEEGYFLAGRSPDQNCFAHGKDPYFPPWTDTAQINYGQDKTMEAMSETILHLSEHCHGFRCDMAMLILKDVFVQTWGQRLGGKIAEREFWSFAIEKLRSAGRSNILIAEAYWGKDASLISHGFDYAYDKHLYDLMGRGDVRGMKDALSAPVPSQEKMVRFLENHDEERAIMLFGSGKIRCAMIIQATIPGMRFWHHGQWDGHRLHIPVQLRRAPDEASDSDLRAFSERLLKEINHPVFHEGLFKMCHTHGWSDNNSHVNLLAWSWEKGDHRRLIIVNFSSEPAQGYITLSKGLLPMSKHLVFLDPIKKESYQRDFAEVENTGLYSGLESGDFHFFIIEKG